MGACIYTKSIDDSKTVTFIVHWNENVILTKFWSLAALEVVILTTSCAANDKNFVNMTTFRFLCSVHMHWL